MEIGWIDFSKDERAKVLGVIDLLSESGTLDELGIAPIRDGFADIFFPGTSTIQTRAKYFLIIPYALHDLESGAVKDPKDFLARLSGIERACGERLVASGAQNVIGSRSLASGSWVKRAPSSVFWAGLRKYGIFRGGRLSLWDYARACCKTEGRKQTLRQIANRRDETQDNEHDDTDAGSLSAIRFWDLPDYDDDWMETLHMQLSHAEAVFLKDHIVQNCPSSMMAFILENHLAGIPKLESFSDFDNGIIARFPQDLQIDYALSQQFAYFLYIARIRYNVMLSRGENEAANAAWADCKDNLPSYADIDVDALFSRLNLQNRPLRAFLLTLQVAMRSGDVQALDDCIRKRECSLKGASRAKLNNTDNFKPDEWIGGGLLDYRFGVARQIMNDIFSALEVG